jgi:hypothetical protein
MSKNDVITYLVDPPSTECDARLRAERSPLPPRPAKRAPLPPKVEPQRAAADAPTGGGAFIGDDPVQAVDHK